MIDAWYEHDIFALEKRREEGEREGGIYHEAGQGNLDWGWNGTWL
jgi:hypothetical protein